MTYTQEPRSNELTVEGFYEALKATDKEYAAFSWNGFNLFGDRKSIKEVDRLMWIESFIKPLQDRIESQKDIIHELKNTISILECENLELVQQIDVERVQLVALPTPRGGSVGSGYKKRKTIHDNY